MNPLMTMTWLCALTAAALAPVGVCRAQSIPVVTPLYGFTGKSDGSNPIGGVVEDSAGVIYGETYTGGTTSYSSMQNAYNRGCGTVYSFAPATGLKVLTTFTGPNGAHGNITLTLVGHTLYGATQQGGASGDGVVFSVNTDGSGYTLLHQFDGTDGSAPAGNLVMGQGSILYGVTNTGGATDFGVLYSIAPTGTYTVLHNFAMPISVNPNALLLAANGTVVGSTTAGGGMPKNCTYGCGTIFTYTPSTGAFATVYTLPKSGANGLAPFVGSIGANTTLYVADSAEIFSLSQRDGFVPIADFDYYAAGAGISSGPVYTPNGSLYGVLGSNQSGASAIYTLQNGVIVDAALMSSISGNDPTAKPYLTSTGSFVGTASIAGHCTYCGGIWEYTP